MNTPEEGSIVPAASAAELHAPPAVLLLNAVVRPAHTVAFPLIADGRLLIVTVTVAMQPAGNVYIIVAVPPAIPATWPEPSTVAFAVLLLLQVPPAVASVIDIVDAAHTVAIPAMAAGAGLIVTVALPASPQAPADDCARK